MQQWSSWSISRSPFHSVLVQGNALRVGGRLHGSPAHQRVFAHRVVPVARPQARYSRSSQGTWETGSFPWILHDISIFCQLWLWKLYFILLNWDMYNIFTVICQLLTGDECGIVGGPSPSLGPLMCASTTSKARPGRVDRWPPRKKQFLQRGTWGNMWKLIHFCCPFFTVNILFGSCCSILHAELQWHIVSANPKAAAGATFLSHSSSAPMVWCVSSLRRGQMPNKRNLLHFSIWKGMQ